MFVDASGFPTTYDANDGPRKFGAGPPCMTDIIMTSPQSLKSSLQMAVVEETGQPSQKNIL